MRGVDGMALFVAVAVAVALSGVDWLIYTFAAGIFALAWATR